jgi:hypothetical protein
MAAACGGVVDSSNDGSKDGLGPVAGSSGSASGGNGGVAGTAAGGSGGASNGGASSGGATNGASGGAPSAELSPYGYCRWAGADGYEPYCAPTYMGHGYSNWHVEGDTSSYCSNGPDCNACLCFLSCGPIMNDQSEWMDIACPEPTSGSASAECLGPPNSNKSCWVTCDHGEQCPDGMRCVDMLELGRDVCAWVNDG